MSITAELNACSNLETFLWDKAKQVQGINERLAGIGNDVLEQHRTNLAHLAELNAPAGTVEELEDDLSDIEDLDKVDMGEKSLV
ncbi:hypothetical protein B0H13DRAFT_2331986 [Mycena leptocephala]|nr:hypothetical protein B0H13DRAFT_2331986 [Mycena leptocephala]